MALEVHPLTPDRWDDLAVLFDRPGDPRGCWCMYWRLPNREFQDLWGPGARAAFQKVVKAGPPPGLLAYRGTHPVGWCAVAPRDSYQRILRSRVACPTTADPTCWATVCFYVARNERGGGIAAELLDAAVQFAAANGAEAVEGYPKDAEDGRRHANEMFVGSVSMFLAAGFEEVGRRAPTRPIMRRRLDQRARRPRRARR
jgi:GNAT superfamily N-acetyltransferase